MTNPREVYKHLNIKTSNYDSRDVLREEWYPLEVSNETCSLASIDASSIGFASSSLLGREFSIDKGLCSEERVVGSPAPNQEVFSGIMAQHIKTKQGIKLGITLQTHQDRQSAVFSSVTAELKRSSRLREIKPYVYDSADFDEQFQIALDQVREAHQSGDHAYAIGRLHERGKRTKWIRDMAAVGRLDSQGCVQRLVLLLGREQYAITMDRKQTPRQEARYHTLGYHGDIVMHKQVPSLETLTRRSL